MKKENISVISDDFSFDSLSHVMSDNPLYFTVLRSRFVDGMSLDGLSLKYPIFRSTIYDWICNFASSNPAIVDFMKKKRSIQLSEDDSAALKFEILRLKKELKDAQMRAHAYDTMIDVAEEMFNIPIRKKAGTKQ